MSSIEMVTGGIIILVTLAIAAGLAALHHWTKM